MSGCTTPDLGYLRTVRRQILEAASRRGLRDVRVFGSVARGDGIETSVEEIVGRHVDVATPRGLKARIRDRVLAEAAAL